MRYVFSVSAGAVVAWSFYPNHWWATIIGIAALLAALDSQPRKVRLTIVTIFALALFGIHLQWVGVLGRDAWLLLVLLCVLPWLLLGFLPIDSKSNWFYLEPALVVIVLEALRGNWPWGGFPWGLIAYSQLDGPFVKLATIGGQSLVSGVVVVCAAAAIKLVRHQSFTALLIVTICLISAKNVDIKDSSESIALAAIQGNVPRVGNALNAQREAVLMNHVKTTERLFSEIGAGVTPAPDLIVWPESGTDIDPLLPGIASDQITQLVAKSDIPILIGATTLSGGSDPTAVGPRNAGILWSAASGPGEMYVKRHLVPFGEYLPFRDFLSRFIKRFDQIPNDFVPGGKVGVFDISGKKVGDVICFEVAYANHIYDSVSEGAQVMVVQTNNATYGNTSQPEQQFAITRFRAIENQRAFLVASTSGISGVIQNDGTVVVRTNQFESAIVSGEVDLITEQTFATKHPKWILQVSSFVLLSLFVANALRERKSSPNANAAK